MAELASLQLRPVRLSLNLPASVLENLLLPISKIELQFGSIEERTLSINDPAVTVFVGPNNSGKSLVLQELSNCFRNGPAGGRILQSVACADFTGSLGEAVLARILRVAGVAADIAEETRFAVKTGISEIGCSKHQLKQQMKDPLSSGAVLPLLIPSVVLDGSARLKLIEAQSTQSLASPVNSFGRLAVNDAARTRLRSILFDAFGKYLAIDLSQRTATASLCFSDKAPELSLERSWTAEAMQFFRECVPIEQFSDGVRAFTGIMVELFAGDPSVLVIDEPEAFLHPSLAFMLGREISRPESTGPTKNVFIATHSSSFLMGCIQSGASVNVVRLERSGGNPTARLLDANSLRVLMRNPLLRSVGAVEALFYDFVVVTEADADRAFYDEINHRLLMVGDPRGISNCLFLRAQNKQTVPDIIKPLRALGIPAAGIIDIDVYEEGGKVWANLVESAGMDSTTADGSAIVRSKVKAFFDASADQPPKKHGGVAVLEGASLRAANGLFDQLDDYGIFTVRRGEVEHWLPGVAPAKLHGPAWLVEAFAEMGDDPNATSYMRPTKGDVWDFIGQIGTWLSNPKRKGSNT